MDGVIGPQTLGAANRVRLDTYTDARCDYYRSLVSRNPKQRKFLKGWLARAEKVANRTLDLPLRG